MFIVTCSCLEPDVFLSGSVFVCLEDWLADTDKSLEELADMLEVMYAIVAARGYSVSELESIRAEKAEKRGGFDKRIFLEKVDEQ